MAITILPYKTPIQLKSITKIPDILNPKNIKNILIVTDKTIKDLGLIIPLETSLKEKSINYFIHDETVPNPTIKNVEKETNPLYPVRFYNKCWGG